MGSLKLAFAGTPEFSVPALQALVDAGHCVAGVWTQPDRMAGRGRHLRASPVKERALALGLPVHQPARLKEASDQAALAALAVDALVVVAYGLILPPAVLALPRLGCFNIHASLLPRWRGAAPIQRAILAGDAETGVTIMRMDAGLDTGPMLLRGSVFVEPHATTRSLQERLAALGAELIVTALDQVAAGSMREVAQPGEGVIYAPKILKSEANVDWTQSAACIDRQIRAFDPWPVAQSTLDGAPLRLWEARLSDAAAGAHAAGTESPAAGADAHAVDAAPRATNAGAHATPVAHAAGVVFAVDGAGFEVACGHGALRITRVQAPGRPTVSGAEFARARKLLGARLGGA